MTSPGTTGTTGTTMAVRTEGLAKHYGHTVALEGLDLEVEPGQVLGYLGPNGAGKSTTISLLLGTIRPTAGTASIFGLDVQRDAEAVHRRLAYVPSVANLWPSLTGAETLRFLGSTHGSVDEAYRDELIGRFELTADKKVRAYSHGNRQKVVLIAAFACRADLLLLDEPTSGLDPLMEQVFRECVREARDRGQTVVLSSHILSEVEAVCDRVTMLRGGRIVETGQLDVLRKLAALRVHAEVAGDVPDLAHLDGVTNVVVDGPVVECDVKGPMEPLLAALAGAQVQRLTTREPSLEELFLSHYGDGGPSGSPGSIGGSGSGVSASAAITRRGFRQIWIGATVCAVVFGGTAASSALSYVTSFPTDADRQQLVATTATDRGLAVLLGPVGSVGTVGGYTVYKGFVFLTTIGAVWALLAANRLLRGEEDSGRWELVLAGATRPARATAATVWALLAAVGVVLVGTTVIVLAAAANPDVGFGAGETVLYGLSIVIAPAVFAAVGAVTSQLGRTRRTANGVGLSVLAVAFVVRMVADAGGGTQWLRWATPFGWTERIAPFTENDPWPMLVAALTVAVLSSVAVVLSSCRDVGSGIISSADVAEPRPFGLSSTLGLAARLELPGLLAWGGGALAAGLSLGFIAKMTEASVPESLSDTLDKFGVEGSFATQYLGVAFLLIATVVALIPAGQLGSAADEQTSGRLAQVLAGPVRRWRWLAERLLLAAAGVAVAGLVAGFGAWAGAATQGVHLDLATMLGAGLNVVPTALVALGVGAVVLAMWPRAAAVAVYAFIGWSLIADLLASMVSGLAWLDRLTLFHSMALAPAADPSAVTLAVTTGVAVVLCALALAIFARRDLQTA